MIFWVVSRDQRRYCRSVLVSIQTDVVLMFLNKKTVVTNEASVGFSTKQSREKQVCSRLLCFRPDFSVEWLCPHFSAALKGGSEWAEFFVADDQLLWRSVSVAAVACSPVCLQQLLKVFGRRFLCRCCADWSRPRGKVPGKSMCCNRKITTVGLSSQWRKYYEIYCHCDVVFQNIGLFLISQLKDFSRYILSMRAYVKWPFWPVFWILTWMRKSSCIITQMHYSSIP